MSFLIEQLTTAELTFSQNDYFGANQRKHILFFDTHSPVLITAPHAVKHARYGNVKGADVYTGALALLTAQQIGVSVLASTSFDSHVDHPTELAAQFIEALDDIASEKKLIIDMHGMLDRQGLGVCVGTGKDFHSENEQRVIDAVSEHLEPFGVSINEPFAAKSDYTLTQYVSRLSPSTQILQLEIAARLRVPKGNNNEELESFLENFFSLVQSLSKSL